MPAWTRLASASLLVAGLAACQDKPVYVDQAWVRLNPNPANPAAAYFTVHGGSNGVTLRDVTSDAAVRVEMHDNVMQNGMMKMVPIKSVDIAAGKSLAFAPGGKHVMLWTINPQIIATGKITLTFIFSNGDRILVDAPIQKGGAAAPAGDAGNMAHGG